MSTKLAKIIADFRTSLSTEIAVGGTSATIQNATDDDGVSLPAGKYFFTLDGNNSVKEHIVCDLSGTSLTNIKSVSRQGVQTTGVARKHRVGATAVITDFAHILYMEDLLRGATAFDATTPLTYDAEPTFVYGSHQIVTWDKSKDYTDSVAVAGAPNASTTVKGIVEIATGAELAAGTATGATGAILVAGGSSFKVSSAGAGDANKIAVLDATGKLDVSFLPDPLSRTADQLQITTDPDTANDAVRKSYADGLILAGAYGDGSDGDVTVASPITLSRNMFYNNLTMSADIDCAGFMVFVKGVLTRSSTAKFKNNGGAGGNGGSGIAGGSPTQGIGGTAGAAPGTGALPGPSAAVAGVNGVTLSGSGNNNGTAGTAGNSVTNSIAAAGTLSGTAGGSATTTSGTGNGGAAGTAATTTQTTARPRSYSALTHFVFVSGSTIVALRCAASGPSGGSGGTSGNNAISRAASGASGGVGASGGMVVVVSRKTVDSGTGAMFQAIGGVGGNGGNGAADGGGSFQAAAGGGAPGQGGHGGIAIHCYGSKTGNCTADVAAGLAGSVGTGQAVGGGSVGAVSAPAASTAGVFIELTQ